MSQPTAQPGIFASVTAGMSIELDVGDGDALIALRLIALCMDDRSALGIGAPLAAALGFVVPRLSTYVAVDPLVERQHALWAFLGADEPGEAFARAQAILAAAGRELVPREATPTFRYREGCGPGGREPGIASLTKCDEARRAVLVPRARLTGGSFAFVQSFVYGPSFRSLPLEAQYTVGRHRLPIANGLADAASSAHGRSVVTRFATSIFAHRRSMLWGDPLRCGRRVVAFTRDLDRLRMMLQQIEDEQSSAADELARSTRPETGGFYFCPPVIDGLVSIHAMQRRADS
jgi:putative iron-dependent peroxidase